MLRKLASLFVTCAFLALPAHAQDAEKKSTDTATTEESGTSRRHGWGFRVGYLLGDEIGKSPGYASAIEGLDRQPEMDDTPMVGVHYWIEGTRNLDVEIRLGAGSTSIEPTCPEATPNSPASCAATQQATDAILWYFEVTLVPHFKLGRTNVGVPVGLGWAALRADDDFAPSALATARDDREKVGDSSGATYSIGLRPYWDIGKKTTLFVEGRLLNMHRLISVNYATARTIEVTAGLNFRFGK